MSKGKLLAIVFVWLAIFGVGAVAWRYVVQPKIDQVEDDRREQRLTVGSSDSRYDYRLDLSLDEFSGYAILRSQEFADELGKKSIKVNLVNDQADYVKRIDDLRTGKSQMAVFTIDALLKTSAQINDLPASIVAIVDETRGADAIVGYKNRFKSVDDFNDPNVRFVLTPDSPSETLTRVVLTHFALPKLDSNPLPIATADGAADVFRIFERSSPGANQVYVLWEPYVSKMLENPNVHTIISSRDLFGYIVDVLVVSRDYLRSHESVVKDVVESYFRATYRHRAKMNELILDDAKKHGEPLTPRQAERLVNGIQWKDTLRNYAHFGIGETRSLQHIEDMIDNIIKVLVTTEAIGDDPTGGKPNLLYYDSILRELASEKFHPAGDAAARGIDDSMQLRALAKDEWAALTPVGTLRVPPLVFARGTATLLDRSMTTLHDLADTLRTQQYYLKIRGIATRKGNRSLNEKLASQRATAAADYLIELGIDKNRIQAAEPTLGDVPSVSFELGQLPY